MYFNFQYKNQMLLKTFNVTHFFFISLSPDVQVLINGGVS